MNSKPPRVSDQISTLATFKRRECTKKPSFGENHAPQSLEKANRFQVLNIVTYVYRLYTVRICKVLFVNL